METKPCPLCNAQTALYFEDTVINMHYFQCECCRLVFQDPRKLPSRDEERARYETHQNSPEDPAYRDFLGKLVEPLSAELAPGAQGLDFGCGPGPTVCVMMEEKGFSVRNYDPVFARDHDAIKQSYDFISCTESVEHFFRPGKEFQLFDLLLKPGATLGIMTSHCPDVSEFADWYYRKDPTHVSFFSDDTMAFIAGKFGWDFKKAGETVTLFKKAA